jgi:hypothetical protein
MISFTQAVAGDSDRPSGSNGSFGFTVNVTCGDTALVTNVVPGVIVATPYSATPVKAVELVQLGESTVRILNVGNTATGILTLTLSGNRANVFTLSTATPGSLPTGGEADIAFTVQSGLDPGDYTATLTATADGMTPVSTVITFTVGPTDIAPIPSEGVELRVAAAGDGFRIFGLIPGEFLTVYDIQGKIHHRSKATATEAIVRLRERSVYVVVAGSRVVKAVY